MMSVNQGGSGIEILYHLGKLLKESINFKLVLLHSDNVTTR